MRSNSIMKLAIAFAIGFLSFAVMASPVGESEGTTEACKLTDGRSQSKRGAGAPKSMADLQRADTGFVHVAADGVARSYNQFGQVLDYVQLDSAKLDKFVASLPPTMPEEEKSEYKDLLAGVNGFDVKSKAQLASLSARLRPATSAPSEEQFTTANKAFEASYALQTE